MENMNYYKARMSNKQSNLLEPNADQSDAISNRVE